MPRRRRHPRGTIIALFLLLVAVLVTSLISTMALTSGSSAQVAALTLKRDQAFYAAEAGVNRALWMTRYGNWAADNYPPFAGSLGDAAYSVSVISKDGLGGVVIRSTGSVPFSSTPASSSITCSIGGLFPVPAVQLGGSFDGGGGDHVAGNMMVNGAIAQHGNFSVAHGNVYAGLAIDAHINLDPGFQQHANYAVPPAPSVQAIADALKANPAARIITSTSTLDFSQSPLGILVYTGSITSWKNPTIVGNGTLVIFGDVSIKSMSSFIAHNVNLVIVGSLFALPGSKFNLEGSLYVQGTLHAQSQFEVQGIILCNDSMSTQGQGSDVSALPPPWFDPRLTSPLGGTLITNFTGPIF